MPNCAFCKKEKPVMKIYANDEEHPIPYYICRQCAQIGCPDIQFKSKDVEFDFWACQRPLTHHWGSGQVLERLEKQFGKIDTVYGKQDQIPDEYFAVDLNNGYDWNKLPFKDNTRGFGYWDPPYDHMYKHEGIEIWRCSTKLAILHTHIFPRAWLKNSKRIGMVAITMGPLKQIRCLQIFEKEVGV